jgi:alpha/beta superfamily hydrolase
MLEGEWHLPPGREPFLAVVVCHPHPLYGGDMLNNIVMAICQELSRHSVAAFRFNFRGVGNSGGSFGGGVAEQEDVRAALDHVLSSTAIKAEKIGLAGYSFGAGVACSVALQDERISRVALVSPTLSATNWEGLKGYGKAIFLIIGDADFYVPLEPFQERIDEIAEPKQYQVVSGADHFWWGYELEVARQVAGFFAAGFAQA